MSHILIADDDREFQEFLDYHLLCEGYTTSKTSDGLDAITIARQLRPDLILLEILLPSLTGFEVTKILKGDRVTRSIPIVIVATQGDESDVVTGLESGATDYIVKPFSVRVLLSRIRTVLRRAGQADADVADGVIRIQGMAIWPRNLHVTIDGNSVSLTPLEFGILALLAQQRNRYFTRTQIIDAIRGDGDRVNERSIDVHISGLRKKLGDKGDMIETVHHLGYRIRQ